MERELYIESSSSGLRIALVEDKKLVELHTDQYESNYCVGDIYIGTAKKISPGLNAVFVDIGYKKDAFLHYTDLGPQILNYKKLLQKIFQNGKPLELQDFPLESEIPKNGNISQVCRPGDILLVRVAKEPISNKGPRVSSELSFPGRYLVLVPFGQKVSISSKITSTVERNRLKKIAETIKPNNFGLIVRTQAEHATIDELRQDLNDLLNKWMQLQIELLSAKVPSRVHTEIGKSFVILRDLLNETFQAIYVDSVDLAAEIKKFIMQIAPGRQDIVKIHKHKRPLFDYFGLETQIKNSFGKKVILKNGAYLIIERTEAFYTIDVNSGPRSDNSKNQEENSLEVNLAAAQEIVRQLRLRDMGGIIVIDFIDMSQPQNRRKLYEYIKNLMKNDRAKHTVLPPSKFGIVQITRQRVREETQINLKPSCPLCSGEKVLKTDQQILDEIYKILKYLFFEQRERKIILHLSPFLYYYLKRGFPSLYLKWMIRLKNYFTLVKADDLLVYQYRIFNRRKEEIII